VTRNYELTVVIPSEITDNDVNVVVQTIQGWIEAASGAIAEVNNWGRRQLAYPIGDSREGTYLLIRADLDPTTVPEIERNLKLSQQILRYLLIRAGE
jgi:small subunit ribosomal protein S6